MGNFGFKTLDEKFSQKWYNTEKIYADDVKEIVNEFCQYLSYVLNNAKGVETRDGETSWTSYKINKNIQYLKLYNNYSIEILIKPIYYKTSQFMPSIKEEKATIKLMTLFNYDTKDIESNRNNLIDALIQILYMNETPEMRQIIQLYFNSLSKDEAKK